MKIESRDQDIRELLSSGYFRIPRFQRPYSWTPENIQDFWDDVVRENPTSYFIGSMVVYKEGNQRFGVVDGQQRLTTIVVLLAVMRDILHSLNHEDLAQGIQNLIERKNIDNQPEYVLSSRTSYPFFEDRVLRFGQPEIDMVPGPEERTLLAAYKQVESLLSAVVASHTSDPSTPTEKSRSSLRQNLIRVRDSVLDLKVILVQLDNEDDAYIIFETLNTRGKDLSLTDLVKNYVNKHLKTRSASIDPTRVKWEKILETIEGAPGDLGTDSFLHHFWLSRYDYLPAKTLFKVLKRRITKPLAKGFLEDLVKDCSLYRSLHDVPFGSWTKQEAAIVDSLKALQLFRVQQQTPCVLSLVRAYKDRKIKKRHLEDALLAIEKFHFLFTAITSQRSSGGISAMYASLGRRIFESTDQMHATSVIAELKSKLQERMPIQEEVRALFPHVIFTDRMTKTRSLVRYILGRFLKPQSKGIVPNIESMTIEHIVPQSRIGDAGFTESVIGQLGNLILVSEDLNSSLANKSFAEKKRILLEAQMPIPKQMRSARDWTPELIAKRTVAMADQAFTSLWRI